MLETNVNNNEGYFTLWLSNASGDKVTFSNGDVYAPSSTKDIIYNFRVDGEVVYITKLVGGVILDSRGLVIASVTTNHPDGIMHIENNIFRATCIEQTNKYYIKGEVTFDDDDPTTPPRKGLFDTIQNSFGINFKIEEGDGILLYGTDGSRGSFLGTWFDSDYDAPLDTLERIFSQLPEIDGYKAIFNYGNHNDLLRFMRQKRNEGVSYYPLIWLETPVIFEADKSKKIYNKVNLIVSTLSDFDQCNKTRNETTIRQTLNPLIANIKQALKQSGVTGLSSSVKEEIFFNYNTNNEKNETVPTDIWDAIKLGVGIYFKNNCTISNIKFEKL